MLSVNQILDKLWEYKDSMKNVGSHSSEVTRHKKSNEPLKETMAESLTDKHKMHFPVH